MGYFAFAVLFGVLIVALTLWAACFTYNRLAGGSDSLSPVPLPGPRKATAIAVVIIAVTSGIDWMLAFLDQCVNREGYEGGLQIKMVSVLVGFLVAAISISFLLPTSPRRAILVALLQTAMQIVVGAVLLVALAAFRIGTTR